MRKDLLTWFEERYQENLKNDINRLDAFEQTVSKIGFEPYSSYYSFAAARSRKYKKPKRPKR